MIPDTNALIGVFYDAKENGAVSSVIGCIPYGEYRETYGILSLG